MPNIKVPMDKRRIIEASDVENMIGKVSTLRDKAVIALYYIFGIRREEILPIEKDDIWIYDGWFYLKIKREKMPKGAVLPRIDTLKVPLNTLFLNYLVEFWSQAPEGILFNYHPNPKTTSHQIYLMVKKANPNVWIHLFRHSRNDYFRRKGYTREQRMAWFGWTDPRTPDKSYSHPSDIEIENMALSMERVEKSTDNSTDISILTKWLE